MVTELASSRLHRTSHSAWEYEDFLVRITGSTPQDHQVQLLRSPYGTAEAPFHLPLNEGSFTELMREVEQRVLRSFRPAPIDIAGFHPHPLLQSKEGTSITSLGRRLFDAIFTGPVREKYLLSLGRVEDSARGGLRVRLLFDLAKPTAPLLYGLP